jgi:predicted nucleotidyltransferase
MDDNEETLSALRSWASQNGNVRELWLFGSGATGGARPGSDVDLAVYLMLHDWALGSYLAHWKKWKGELEAILGHKVDIGALGPGTKLEEEVRRTGKCLWPRDSQAYDKEN